MPRSVATRVKGGASRTRRIRYTFREKINFLSALLDMQQSKGISLRSAASELQISHQNLSRWKRNDDVIINNSKSISNKKSITEGLVGELDSVKEDLLHWIFELREMGHAVDRFMVVIKSCVLLPDLVEKGERAIYKIATRFLARFSLVYRMGTKESQRPPHEVAGEALDFIENARARLVGCDPRFIINMDQTPVYFSMHSKKTLSKMDCTRRVTVAATITVSGDQLLPWNNREDRDPSFRSDIDL